MCYNPYGTKNKKKKGSFMKSTRKILVALLVVLTLLMSMTTITAFAAKTTGDTTIFLTPNSNWKSDGARFAAYTWDIGNTWFDMTDPDGDGVYACVIPAGVENIIFCRMNPGTSENNWNNKWNQTGDLKYDGKNNHYTINEGQWDSGTNGVWSLIETGECIHSPSGEGSVITPASCTENGEISHLCSKCGKTYTAPIFATGHNYGADGACANCNAYATYIIAGDVHQINSEYQTGDNATIFGTSWDVTNEANKLEYDAELGCFVKVYTGVAAGEYDFKVTVDKSWNESYGANGGADNCYINVAQAGSTVTITFKENVPSVTVTTSDTPVDPDPTPDTDKVYIAAGDVMMDATGEYVPGGVNFFGTIWNASDETNLLVYDEETGAYVKVYENVFAGEYHFKVTENKTWTVSYGENGGADNCYINVAEDGSTVTISFKDGIPSATVTAPQAPVDPNPDPTPNPGNPDDENPGMDCTDPDPNPENPADPEPEQPGELTLVQKILKAVTDFFANISAWFKNLFAGFKK